MKVSNWRKRPLVLHTLTYAVVIGFVKQLISSATGDCKGLLILNSEALFNVKHKPTLAPISGCGVEKMSDV